MGPKYAGYQCWRDLLFVHWKVDPKVIQQRLPDGLEVETFDGSAWLGVVPFSMERIRSWWSPPLPGISWFLETNLRTYVRHQNGETGVWFFSLDATNFVAVTVAKKIWHLNYRMAPLSMKKVDRHIHYSGNLTANEYHLEIELPTETALKTSVEGTIDHFLLERYRLFAQRRDGRFFTGLVHHEPYQFKVPEIQKLRQQITDQVCPDIANKGPAHLAWSPGVDVAVSKLEFI
ncbi:MAG: DUF2071 domain-containing protein [Planctomycetota bacterium]